DEGYRLLGTVTDGDIRRGILRGISLEDSVAKVMNVTPTVAKDSQSHHDILKQMKAKRLHQIPVLEDSGHVVGVRFLNDFLQTGSDEHWVILMAGGLGTRLRPLTNDLPKALLPVGDKPLLEHIINQFAEQGFHRFFISLHYKADMVFDLLGDGSKLGVQISYLHEQQQLGTAGALGLLPERPTNTFLVMNADLVTQVNFSQLLAFHKEQQATATMCVQQYDFQVPYGVIQLDGCRVAKIDEKPTQSFFVNAGICAFEPSVLDYVNVGEHLDMPALFTKLMHSAEPVSAFAVREQWLDIGRKADYQKAQEEFSSANILSRK
ncbi:MAG: nucleotidyltransferase family protein, partial [Candidatus Obscuribacterales bacterium]|nr:nucleotidyltransferase family protein [Candidatus Obscuribacterales bacterium]